MPTTWGADWDYFGAADRRRHTLCPCPCIPEEASIVTILKYIVIVYLFYN